MRSAPLVPPIQPVAPIQPVGRRQIIDDFGELDRQMRLIAPRHKALKYEIAGWFSDLPADQTFVAEGKLYTIQIGKKENRRTITNPARAFNLLKKTVGLVALLRSITIPLKAIDDHVPIEIHPSILTQERTGPRDIVAVAKVAVEGAQPAAA